MLRLVELPPFLGDLGRDLQLADVVHQAGQPGLFDFNRVHAELTGHQHGDEGHVQAVLQQDVGVRAANEVQAERAFVGTDAGGGVAHYLRRVGEPFVRLEVECPQCIAQLGHGLPEGLVGGAQGAAKGFLIKRGRAALHQLFDDREVRPGGRNVTTQDGFDRQVALVGIHHQQVEIEMANDVELLLILDLECIEHVFHDSLTKETTKSTSRITK